MQEKRILVTIRLLLIFFMICLILSGITAFILEAEVSLLVKYTAFLPDVMQAWFHKVHEALQHVNANYPFINYGTDWLAFAHIVIAVAFIGPLRDPVKNIWVIQFGMIACLLILPLALIMGEIRGIPFFWRVFDCSFGIIGLIPLYWCYKLIRKVEGK